MNWLHYLLEANLYLAVFYAGYCLFLNKETHYTLNRVYLLLSCVVSFILPVIQISTLKPAEVAQQTYIAVSPVASKTTAQPVINYQPQVSRLTLQDVIWYIYIAGVVVLSVLLIIKIVRLIKMATGAKTLAADDYTLVGIKDSDAAFSFFNYLFIGTKTAGNELIIRHELVHIRQKHSADILFIELLRIINWFNPIIYLLQASVKTVHEYIADEQTATLDTDPLTYSSFLVDNAYGINGSSIAHSFYNYNLLKKRIIMLNQKRSGNLARLKYLVAVPICGGLLCASTLAFSKNYALVDLAPKHHAPMQATLPDSGQKSKPQNAPQLPPPPPPMVIKDSYTDLFNHLVTAISYPRQASNAGVAGVVGVSFNVKADHQIDNIKVSKSASPILDAEVLKAVKAYTGKVDEPAGPHKIAVYFTNNYYKFIKTKAAAELNSPGYDLKLQMSDVDKFTPIQSHDADKKPAEIPASAPIKDATKLPPPPPPVAPVQDVVAAIPSDPDLSDFYKYVGKHVRYPTIDYNNRIGGRVITTVDVVDGKITNPKVVRGIEPVMNGEVLRVLNEFDGKLDLKNGHYSIPVAFELLDPKNNQVAHAPETPATDTQKAATDKPSEFSTTVSLNQIVVVGYVTD
ncbi:M56 family metallopeptidase [Mucilaginibacter flavus]|uniref:M56 family metallopeptidase n=1 Tax=Mucilaginibacter flavus TaxID=931504 RepID=UPI0025B52E2A|nr:M56 family metallopeptidase [Mucilaginibacter flavus]MDN3579873.1 TonB family protein [Mucilaginibacter flavus]